MLEESWYEEIMKSYRETNNEKRKKLLNLSNKKWKN